MNVAGQPEISFEDYVGMSGVAKAWGIERMLAHYGIDMARWTQIATSWNQTIPTDMARYGMYGMLVEQEGTRVATGGTPRALGAAPTAPAPAPQQAQPGQQYPQQQYPQQQYPQQQYPQQQQQPYTGQQFERDAAKVGNAIGNAASAGFSALGNAFGGLAKPSTIAVGPRVLVTWTDGNRYPGTVAQVAQGQYLITRGDGQQHWIGAGYVTVA